MPVIGKYKGREITGGSQDVVNAQVRAIEALGNSNSASQTTPQSTGGGQLTPTFTAGNTRGGQAMPDRINIGGKSYSFDKVQGSPDLREQYLAQQNQQQEQAPEIAPQEVEEQAEVTPFEPQVTTQPEDIRSQALEFLRERGFDSPDDETIQGVAEQLSGGVQGTGATGSESPFVQGFIGATQRGVEAPTGPAQGQSLVQSYLPEQPETQIANDLFATDPFFSQLQQSLQDYFNPRSQRESLTSIYQDMLEDSGIEAIDMELIDMKNVIEGTEDDIRTEVTKAGGFASDSQVLALANARNKQLIKNYNTLLETRNAKQQYLDKMMDLSVQDREVADRQFNTMMNFGFQVANFKQQARQNAISQYNTIAANVGYDGLMDMVGNDPYQIQSVERLMGMSPGGLQQLSDLSAQERAREQQLFDLEVADRRASIAMSNAKIAALAQEKQMNVDKLQKKADIALEKAGIVTGKVHEAIDRIGPLSHTPIVGGATGFVGGVTRWIPGTPSYKLNKTIDTIKANLGFDTLQAMRDASPTGGALGQVAVQELENLQATISSLDIGQDAETLEQNLGAIEGHYVKWIAISYPERLGEIGYGLKPNGEVFRFADGL